MPDYINDIMNTQVFGIPLPVLVAVAVLVVFFMIILLKAKKNKDDRPPIIDPEVEIGKDFAEIINNQGEKVTYKSYLLWSMIRLGRIVAFTPFKYENEIDLKGLTRLNSNLGKLRMAVTNKEDQKYFSEENFILFAVCGKSAFHYLFYMFGFSKPKYYLVDKAFISQDKGNNVYIELEAMPFQFYKNIFVFSLEGKKVIQGMVNHMNIKTILKENINFIPQLHYFDYKTGRFVAKADAIRTQKKKAWKDKEQSLEEEIKEADTDE